MYFVNVFWPLWNIYVTNDHGYVPLVVNTSRSFPRSWLIIGFVTTLTRPVPLVEQALHTLPEHRISPPGFWWGSCYSIFSFICTCMFCRSLLVLLYFFFRPLWCLFFFNIWILITPLLSSNSLFLIKNGKEIWVGICCSWFSKKLIDTVHYIDVLMIELCLYKCYSSRENQPLVTTQSCPFLHLTLSSAVPGDSRRAADSLDFCQCGSSELESLLWRR